MWNLIAFAFICFVSFTNGVYNPQTSISVTQISPNTVYNGVLDAVPVQENYHVEILAFYIPKETRYVNIDFVNVNTNLCDYVHVFFMTNSLPCAYDDYEYTDFICSNPSDPNNGVVDYITYYPPGYQDYGYEWVVGDYWYIGVGRYSVENGNSCPYTFSYNTTVCPAGTVGVAYELATGDFANCSGPVTVVTTLNTPISFVYDSLNGYNIFEYNVTSTAFSNITIVMNTTNNAASLIANSYGTPTTSIGNYKCESQGSTTDPNGSGNSIVAMICFVPRKGIFYIAAVGGQNATLTVIPNECSGQTGGYNCAFGMTGFTLDTLPFATSVNVSIPYISDGFLSYNQYIFYVDVPPRTTNKPDVYLNFTTSGGSAVLLVRRDGFPEYDQPWAREFPSLRKSLPGVFGLTSFEYYTGGRYYFSVACLGSRNCSVSLKVIPLSGGLTTGVTTQGVTTVERITTADGSTTDRSNVSVTTGAPATTGQGITTGQQQQQSTTGVQGSTTSRQFTTSPLDTGSMTTGANVNFGVQIVPSILVALFAIILMF